MIGDQTITRIRHQAPLLPFFLVRPIEPQAPGTVDLVIKSTDHLFLLNHFAPTTTTRRFDHQPVARHHLYGRYTTERFLRAISANDSIDARLAQAVRRQGRRALYLGAA